MFDISLCITAGSPERDTELSSVRYVQFAPYVMHKGLVFGTSHINVDEIANSFHRP